VLYKTQEPGEVDGNVECEPVVSYRRLFVTSGSLK